MCLAPELDTNLKKFRAFDDQVRNIYDEMHLLDVSEANFEGQNSGIFFSDSIRSKSLIHNFEYSHFKSLDEFHFISRDIKYLTALTYFFRPFISDPTVQVGYQATLEDRRYLVYCSLCLQAIYNFWDRIGDLLWKFFETGLNEKSVYIGRVINNIPQNYRGSDNYTNLKFIYESSVSPILGLRHEVVHYYQLECKMTWGSLELSRNSEQLQELQREKESYPDLYREQLNLCIKGFEITLKLIRELPDNALSA